MRVLLQKKLSVADTFYRQARDVLEVLNRPPKAKDVRPPPRFLYDLLVVYRLCGACQAKRSNERPQPCCSLYAQLFVDSFTVQADSPVKATVFYDPYKALELQCALSVILSNDPTLAQISYTIALEHLTRLKRT